MIISNAKFKGVTQDLHGMSCITPNDLAFMFYVTIGVYYLFNLFRHKDFTFFPNTGLLIVIVTSN